MRFICVNDGLPRKSSTCARCGVSLRAGYFRDISSRLPYCSFGCQPRSDDPAAPARIPKNPGLVGVCTTLPPRRVYSSEKDLLHDLPIDQHHSRAPFPFPQQSLLKQKPDQPE